MEALLLSTVEVNMKKIFLRVLEKIGLLSPLEPNPMVIVDPEGRAREPFVGPRSRFEQSAGETP